MSLTTNLPTDLDVRCGLVHAGMTEAQVGAIERELGDRYVIDRHSACEEGLAVMITAADAIDLDTVLYVDAEPVGLSLSSLRGDILQHQGCYTSIGGLLSAILALG